MALAFVDECLRPGESVSDLKGESLRLGWQLQFELQGLVISFG
jgi:hypothetical protein